MGMNHQITTTDKRYGPRRRDMKRFSKRLRRRLAKRFLEDAPVKPAYAIYWN